MVWWAVGAEGQMQALFALLTQMSCSRRCLTQIGKLSPILGHPCFLARLPLSWDLKPSPE